MKSRLILALTCLSFAAVSAARADDATPAAPAAAPAPAAHKPKTPLEKQMTKIRHAMRALKTQASDPAQNAAALASVATIHDAATASLDLTPAKASDLTGADRDQFLDHYRAAMKEFIAAVDSLSDALKAGDNAKAAKIYSDLPGLEKKDHKQFRRPEKE